MAACTRGSGAWERGYCIKDIDSPINAPSVDGGNVTGDLKCTQTLALALKVRIKEKKNACQPHSQAPMQVSWEQG